MSPLDGGDPYAVSQPVLARETRLEVAARRRVGNAEGDGLSLAAERHRAKHFPILLISAPHIEDAVSGTFPGTPTPLLQATSVVDRLLRIDEFPADRVPEIVAVMNPLLYSNEFRAEVRALVTEHQPRLVGISNLSEGHHFALEIAELVKSVRPSTIILMGGQHEDGTNPVVYERASERARQMNRSWSDIFRLAQPGLERVGRTQTLASPDEREIVDFVAAGDCQYLFLEFIVQLARDPDASASSLKHRIKQAQGRFAVLPGSGFLFFYDEGRDLIEHVQLSGQPLDGDALPFIDLGALTHENRFPVFGNKLTAQVMACLGCKYACAFCHESADHFLYGVPKLLQRSVEHVMAELRLRHEQGYEAVFFDDSTFTQDRRWLSGFLDNLEREIDVHEGGWLEWGCQTTINDLALPIVARMSAAGCTYIYFGVESARPNPEMVQKTRRTLRAGEGWLDRFVRVSRWCRDSGVRVGTSLQFGLGESLDERERTLDAVAALYHEGCIAAGCVALNINAPYPGTEQWLRLIGEEGLELPDYRERLVRHPAFETAHQFTALAASEIEQIHRQAAEKLGDAVLSVNFEAQERWRQAQMPSSA